MTVRIVATDDRYLFVNARRDIITITENWAWMANGKKKWELGQVVISRTEWAALVAAVAEATR